MGSGEIEFEEDFIDVGKKPESCRILKGRLAQKVMRDF